MQQILDRQPEHELDLGMDAYGEIFADNTAAYSLDAYATGKRTLHEHGGSQTLDVQVMSGVDGRGIELSREGVNRCVAKGLAVIQGDADTDLADYPNDAFDYVILSQTLQATRQPRDVVEHMLRIARHAVVSFPNFGHWQMRWRLLVRGRMPDTETWNRPWYETPNIHHCTIRDFVGLCREVGARIERATALDARGHEMRFSLPWWVWNLMGAQGVFLLRRGGGPGGDTQPAA